MESNANAVHREPWNKGKIVGQKAPFKLKDIWALRVRLQMENRVRELALFDLGIDSKLRGCDLMSLKVRDICHGDPVATRAIVMHKTQRLVQFEITLATCDAVQKWTSRLPPSGPLNMLKPARWQSQESTRISRHTVAHPLRRNCGSLSILPPYFPIRLQSVPTGRHCSRCD